MKPVAVVVLVVGALLVGVLGALAYVASTEATDTAADAGNSARIETAPKSVVPAVRLPSTTIDDGTSWEGYYACLTYYEDDPVLSGSNQCLSDKPGYGKGSTAGYYACRNYYEEYNPILNTGDAQCLKTKP